MPGVEIKATPPDLGASELAKLADRAEDAVPRAAQASGAAAMLALRTSLARIRGTGALEDSFRLIRGEAGAQLVSDSPHARITDEGGTIRARRGRFMTIDFRSSFARVRKVRVPARHYLDAVERAEAIEHEFGAAIDKEISRP